VLLKELARGLLVLRKMHLALLRRRRWRHLLRGWGRVDVGGFCLGFRV
jgi:hypothetical protein